MVLAGKPRETQLPLSACDFEIVATSFLVLKGAMVWHVTIPTSNIAARKRIADIGMMYLVGFIFIEGYTNPRGSAIPKLGIFASGSETRKVHFDDERRAWHLHMIVEGCREVSGCQTRIVRGRSHSGKLPARFC